MQGYLTNQKCKWCPNNFKYPRNFPYQNDSQKATGNLNRHD